MKNFIYVLIFFEIFLTSEAFGQRDKREKPKKSDKAEDVADIALQEGKFEKALITYRELLDKNKNSARLNFLVGYCYLNIDYGLDQSIEFLSNSVKLNKNQENDSAPIEASYYLAKAYYLNSQFNLALDVLSALLTQIPKNNKEFISQADKLVEMNENAAMLSQTSTNANIDNIFEINSKYSDSNPLLFNNDKEIVFTSRKESQLSIKKLEDEQFDENIYYTKLDDEEWSAPYGISKTINSINHEAACWISEKGDQIIFCKIESNEMVLYQSSKNIDGEWIVPEKLAEPINEHSQQSFASISTDDKFIYFTSNRKGGYGGMDIYVSEIIGKNIYGTPKNLGPGINTPFNEESPVMHENGVLFFSSQGHNSMGGLDIYASYKDISGKWIEPINLGLPINSIENDFFYKPASNGQMSFSSSERKGTKGKSDVYKISNSDSINNGFALLSGKIQFQKKIKANKNIEIKIKNIQDNKYFLNLKPNANGYFNFILPAKADYQISFFYENTLFYGAKLIIPKSYSYLCMDQSITMQNIKLDLDNNLQVINKLDLSNKNEDVFYSVNKSTELIKSSFALALINKSSSDSLILSEINEADENSNNLFNKSDSLYSIKILSSKSRIPLSNFAIADQVKEYIDNKGNYIYYTGSFNYEWEALIQLRRLKEKYPDATIFLNDFISELTN